MFNMSRLCSDNEQPAVWASALEVFWHVVSDSESQADIIDWVILSLFNVPRSAFTLSNVSPQKEKKESL